MNIIYVCDKINIHGGGSNMSIDLLCRKLHSRGHHVKVLTLNTSGENQFPSDVPYSVERGELDQYNNVSIVNSGVKLLRKLENEADIFHVFTPKYMYIGGIYKRSGATPVICRLNSYNFCSNLGCMNSDCYKDCTISKKLLHDDCSILKKVMKFPLYVSNTHVLPIIARNIDQFFAQSPSVKEAYRVNGIKAERISVVPNFFNPEFNNIEDYKGTNGGSVELLYVGRLTEQKGIDVLLNALKYISDNISLKIIGSGPKKENLEEISREVANEVIFKGRVSHKELPPHYVDADIFVHPGTWPDPCPRTVLESLQHSTPVIASDIGGPPWMIGNAGLSFEPGDEEQLAGKIEELATNETLKSRMEENTSRRIKHFRPTRIIDKIDSLYRNISTE